MTKTKTLQPPFNKALVLGLTPQEIFKVCAVGAASCCTTSYNSFVDSNARAIFWRHDVVQERTGNFCRIAAVETVDNDDVLEYIVELSIGDAFIAMFWESNNNSMADMEYIKQCAHQSYCIACALIGVRVGSHLVTDPSEY